MHLSHDLDEKPKPATHLTPGATTITASEIACSHDPIQAPTPQAILTIGKSLCGGKNNNADSKPCFPPSMPKLHTAERALPPQAVQRIESPYISSPAVGSHHYQTYDLTSFAKQPCSALVDLHKGCYQRYSFDYSVSSGHNFLRFGTVGCLGLHSVSASVGWQSKMVGETWHQEKAKVLTKTQSSEASRFRYREKMPLNKAQLFSPRQSYTTAIRSLLASFV
eukprot:2666664-Amphidinium_carterae.1